MSESEKKLSFRSGQFELTDAGETTSVSLKEAVALKRYADEKAGRVIERALVKKYQRPAVPLPPFLDPHQKDGVSWVLTRSRSYLAHAPGAGKTCEAITAAMLAPGEGQAVFIVPPSLTVNWAREIEKFTALVWDHQGSKQAWADISIIPKSNRQASADWRAGFLIVPDSLLTRPWILENLRRVKKKFIAVDEASRFKESTSQRTIALFGGTLKGGVRVPGLIADTRHAVLLDGSPMPNRPMELWAPTYAMAPEAIDFMDQTAFGYRYCGARLNDFGRWEFKHSKNEAELKLKLQKDFMHVVTESQLNHPERLRSLLFMSEDVRSPTHREWEKIHLKDLKLDQVSEALSQGQLASFRKELGIRKAPWVADYVAERLSTKQEAILVFAWHRDVCFELEKRLKKFRPGLILGGTSDAEREKHLAQFQNGETDLLILNIIAGGRGHNLQRGDRAVFAEFSWSDETNRQCEKRISRRGNDKAFMRSEYVCAPNSMDEKILNAVFRKEERVRKVIG